MDCLSEAARSRSLAGIYLYYVNTPEPVAVTRQVPLTLHGGWAAQFSSSDISLIRLADLQQTELLIGFTKPLKGKKREEGQEVEAAVSCKQWPLLKMLA